MSVFTDAEIEYLQSQRHGHLATVGRNDQRNPKVTFLVTTRPTGR
jgi:hypothetical protein